MKFFIVFQTVSGILVDFTFPEEKSLFCPIDKLLFSNSIVNCTNSAFSDSICRYSCPKNKKLFAKNRDGLDSTDQPGFKLKK